MPHPSTLFHLCPTNDNAHGVLDIHQNRLFVSDCPKTKQRGLEIGFHVSRVPGRVMAQLGRGQAADLIFRGLDISSIHIAFEVHPETHVVLLSVRSRVAQSVTVKVASRRKGANPNMVDPLAGGVVLAYGQDYELAMGAYNFKCVWVPLSADNLKKRAVEDLNKALAQARLAHTQDLPTQDNSTMHTWHNTRISTAMRTGPLFSEAPGSQREILGEGGFGEVYKATDAATGHPFAIKVMDLVRGTHGLDRSMASAHAEIKALERLKHKHIIEMLHVEKWDTPRPEIWMPLREGNLRDLVKRGHPHVTMDELCSTVLKHMLSALDFTAHHQICHRDVKPENILYYDSTGKGQYTFELADFGLARHQSQAETRCGTDGYMAPEMFKDDPSMPQTPKVDVWSLFVTILSIHTIFPDFPLPRGTPIDQVVRMVQAAAQGCDKRLSPMAHEDPRHRASAAQMLVDVFDSYCPTTQSQRHGHVESLLEVAPHVPAVMPSHMSGALLSGQTTLAHPFSRFESFPGVAPSVPEIRPTYRPWPVPDANRRITRSQARKIAAATRDQREPRISYF